MMISKATNDFSNFDFTNGEVILIDKDLHASSFNVVYKLRKITGIKKIGHAGTLDPLATGLLIICTGKKTKEISHFQDLKKVYSGKIILGKRTASMDAETDVIEEHDTSDITLEKIISVKEAFVGKIEQTPPMYSAVKHKGKSLYKYARKGVEIERNSRSVEIYDFEISNYVNPEIHFRISCSKGTYIRAIANDLGDKLGCGGYLKELRREAIGQYNVDVAFTIKEFEKEFNSITVDK
ncbi:MAG: tRNA pseudouridine(55) synthase TruB [Melioribacteraceae bacterium]|nr:tRNA pseudouridine(55) synthase TruB [Melioribacteraceae bacterium]WKZ68656.1 MAG: tRNA pseudouridine(55) synthase TruB [Melioribacteraceae bacterium]